MRRLFTIILLLWSLLLAHQTAWADGVTHVALWELFDVNNGTGGNDNSFSGSIASSKIDYELDGWSGESVYGAKQCLKFGTGSANGHCTTPDFVLIGSGKTATLTFRAAGWGSGTNTLEVSSPTEGVTLSGDIGITLVNSTWTNYSVTITSTSTQSVQLTFTGKRGFLDDVKVTETVSAINTPTLPSDFTFFPNTTEVKATKSVTLIPSDSTTVYYTTDGSEPTTSNGQAAMLTSNIVISGTTTIKARAYYETVASQVVTKTYTQGNTVSGIEAFNGLSNDTEARLFIAADDQARVLHGADGKLYLRDNTATLCLDFGTTATFNPEPQHNQHVAGWIVGKKQTVNGLPKLVATSNTTTDFLALAAPVTEPATAPVAVSDIANVNSYVGNWVKAENVRNDQTNVTLTDIYGQALVDVSGIVTANGTITPVEIDNIKSVVYVIDEDETFVSPDADIDNATVRLKRTLSKDYWNTFAVPFDIAAMEGSIREYDQADGNVMKFTNATDIEAGKPYLVKPTADIVNPTYQNITLKATAAQSVSDGDYSFVATYSPKALKTDQTELFLKPDGMLYYSNNGSSKLKGMRAYFQVPAGQNARIMVVDDADMATVISRFDNGELGIENVYNLNGQRVKQPGRGIYIVNGKKVFIQ